MVPIPHSTWKIGTNTSHISYQYLTLCKNTHEVKFHIAYMRIPQIDTPQSLLHFAFDSNIHSLSLTSVTIMYQFFICVIIWYQVFTCVRIWYQFFTRVSLIPFFTCDDLRPIFHGRKNLVPILDMCEKLVPIIHICENLVPILHIVLVLQKIKTTKM